MKRDDLDDEIRAHLDLETERNLERGMSPEEARAAAQRAFGNVTRAKERVWEMQPGAVLYGWRQDLRFALRSLRRAPGFAMAAGLTLALGLGASVTMFRVLRAVLLRPFPYDQPERLYEMAGVSGGRPANLSAPDFEALRRRSAAAEMALLGRYRTVALTGVPEAASVFVQSVTAGVLPVLGVQPMLGRLFTEEEAQAGAARAAVISHRLWQRSLERDPNILGRTIWLGGESYAVIGVMPPGFQYPNPFYDVWVPWTPGPEDMTDRTQRRFTAVVRLRPGARIEQARAEMEAAAAELDREQPGRGGPWRPVLTRIGERRVASVRESLRLLAGAVGCVLLMACLNAANLLLARASQRRGEIAIRAALGAGRSRLVRQMLVESLTLAGLGGVLGLGLAFWAVRTVRSHFSQLVPRIEETRVDAQVLGFALAATLVTGALFGLWPALRATSARVETSRVRVSPPGMLATAQVAICLVLLTGAGLMLRTLARLLEVDPGFRAQKVLAVSIPGPYPLPDEARQAERYRRIVEAVGRLPGVEAAALNTVLPLGPLQANLTFGIAERPAAPTRFEELPRAQLRTVSADYFRVMGIPLLRGRSFTEADGRSSPGVVIINEELARRYWPGEDAVGKRLQTNIGPSGPWLTVVGVAGNVKHESLRSGPDPELYRPYQQYLGFPQLTNLVVRTAVEPASLAETIRREIRRIEPEQPIREVQTMERFLSNATSQPRFYAVLLGAFAGLALAVAASGLLGVLSYSVSRRTQEIGVRMALGARPGDVLRMVLGDGARYLAAGAGLGLAGSLASSRLLRNLLFGVGPADPLTFVLAGAVLAAAALAATAIPARRAAAVDPMTALRHE